MSNAKKVLIVDDDEDFSVLAAVRIEEAGYKVEAETDGGKVLGRVRDIHPDLLLLDIMLGGDGDGFSILKKIKKEMPDLPVIVVTGKAVMMSDIFSMEGSSGFFKKPPDFKELVSRIKDLI